MKLFLFILTLLWMFSFSAQNTDSRAQSKDGLTQFVVNADGSITKDTTSADSNVAELYQKIKPDNRDVSLIKLIMTPEKYDGEMIQVIGYLNLEFEGNAIYLHKEDYEHGITQHGFWVDFPEKFQIKKKVADYSKSYVILIGTFDAKDGGHFGMFGGTIKNIKRLDFWR